MRCNKMLGAIHKIRDAPRGRGVFEGSPIEESQGEGSVTSFVT